MLMHKRGSFARLAVGLVVFASPLLATSVASAAIAGGILSTTTTHPDIRSATIDPKIGLTGVRVCFDKALDSTRLANGFFLGGYRAGNLVEAATVGIDSTDTMCAKVLFPASAGDINNYTFVEVAAGAVSANAGLAPNLFDSIDLTGSTSHSGTRGLTTAPNLVGVLAPTSVNKATHSLTYVFDKNTHSSAAMNNRYFFETAAGQLCLGTPTTPPLSGNEQTTITIEFNDGASPFPGTCGGVVKAVKAGIFRGAVTALYDPASSNPDVATNLPNCASPCSTQRPDLVSAVLNANQDQITYTFDRNVMLLDKIGFRAELANGESIGSTSAQCNGTTVCTAQFSGNLSTQSEFAVGSWAELATVKLANTISPTPVNLPGYAPVGENAGALSRGFTTGPDVFGIVINKITGQIDVNLDARVNTVAASNSGLIRLMDGAGEVISGSYTATFNVSAGPGPEQVVLQYPASVLTNATQIQFLGGGGNAAFTSPFDNFTVPADAQNIAQIVGAVNSAAILKAYNARHVER